MNQEIPQEILAQVNPYRKLVRTIRVQLVKYDPKSEDARTIQRMGIPLRCQCCDDYYDPEHPESVQLMEVVVIVEQKILLPDNIISQEYMPNPFLILYCQHCIETVFGGRNACDLPFYQ